MNMEKEFTKSIAMDNIKKQHLSVLSSKMKLLTFSLDFMHLLGTIISVHSIEKARQHALKYSRAVPNSKARLQHLELT